MSKEKNLRLITCQRCGKQEWRRGSAKYCLDCAPLARLEYARRVYHGDKPLQIKYDEDGRPMSLVTCQRCGKQEWRYAAAKYCLDCAPEVRREQARQWWREANRKRGKKTDENGRKLHLITCECCGKQEWRHGGSKYCTECAHKVHHGQMQAWQRKFRGKNHDD